MMESTRKILEERIDKAINIRVGYKADSGYILDYDNETYKTKQDLEDQYKQLIEINQSLDTKLKTSGKRSTSNLDYESADTMIKPHEVEGYVGKRM